MQIACVFGVEKQARSSHGTRGASADEHYYRRDPVSAGEGHSKDKNFNLSIMVTGTAVTKIEMVSGDTHGTLLWLAVSFRYEVKACEPSSVRAITLTK